MITLNVLVCQVYKVFCITKKLIYGIRRTEKSKLSVVTSEITFDIVLERMEIEVGI